MDLQDSQGKTPLHIAAGTGYPDSVTALLKANADTAVKDKMGRSALEYAQQKMQTECVHALQECMRARQQENIEVDQAVRHAAASPFGPYLPEGSETTPNSKGLSLVVYHQVEWLIHRRILRPNEITDRVMTLLQSSDTCIVLSTLKEYENRHEREESVPTLEHELSFEIPRSGSMQGVWQGLVQGRPFGFILGDDRRRVWCHERQLMDEQITAGTRVSFQLQSRNGKEEASMVQVSSSTGHGRKTQLAPKSVC